MSEEHLPKVLLLGDSIRKSYQPRVTELLAGEADVVGPEENGQFSAYTLAGLDGWLEELGPPDLVHWNNGLHDIGHNPDRTPAQVPLDVYCDNLRQILRRLRATGAVVIWATTTPVHPDAPFPEDRWAWKNEEIDLYNRAALDIMEDKDVPVNDLHAVVASDPDRYLCEDQLHLSEAGVLKCSEAVAGAVRAHLSRGGQESSA
jgi:lysophospholipase L1-like esterase